MIPIYEQGGGRGIGLTLDMFVNRFDEILERHISDNRALAFAIILYDFTDGETKKALKDLGVFAKLDRLSGSELSVFFVHTATKHGMNRFNEFVEVAFGLRDVINFPAIILFRIENHTITDIRLSELGQPDLLHTLDNLSSEIEQYKSGLLSPAGKKTIIPWLSGRVDKIETAFITALISKMFS